jgi:hypothetical protein
LSGGRKNRALCLAIPHEAKAREAKKHCDPSRRFRQEGPTPVMPGLKMKVPPVFVVKVGSTMPLNWSPLGAGLMVTHVWTK